MKLEMFIMELGPTFFSELFCMVEDKFGRFRITFPMNRKSLINRLGLPGIVSLASYTAAVVFALPAYPNYNLLSQAVSDLSAANAPPLML